MAVRSATLLEHGASYAVYEWAGLLTGDTGQPLSFPVYPDRSVTVEGTNGVGGACAMEGSNTPAGTDWAALHNPAGAVIAAVDGEAAQVLESTLRIRPSVVGDGSTSYAVRILFRLST